MCSFLISLANSWNSQKNVFFVYFSDLYFLRHYLLNSSSNEANSLHKKSFDIKEREKKKKANESLGNATFSLNLKKCK